MNVEIAGYRFKKPELLQKALTHTSYSNEKHLESNQRLEFLGDSVIGLVIGEYIYEKYPSMPEGELSKIRAGIVCENGLVKCAEKIELGRRLLLGRGEEMSEATATILVPVIAGIFTLVGVILTLRESNHKQIVMIQEENRKQTEAVKDELKAQHEEFKVEQAVMTEQIEGLRIATEKHNNFGVRIQVMEEQIKSMDYRIKDLEDDRK